MPTVRILVRGHVQGVGFRAFVVRIATGLGVEGIVWNRADGSVELIASHPESTVLRDLEANLQKGPGFVDFVESEPAPDFPGHGFVVGPSR
ncbi:MAG: acylphosphatase [Armatimonadetes bacterium]|nr:acylphosphatase [Armatimonadota bacterium]